MRYDARFYITVFVVAVLVVVLMNKIKPIQNFLVNS